MPQCTDSIIIKASSSMTSRRQQPSNKIHAGFRLSSFSSLSCSQGKRMTDQRNIETTGSDKQLLLLCRPPFFLWAIFPYVLLLHQNNVRECVSGKSWKVLRLSQNFPFDGSTSIHTAVFTNGVQNVLNNARSLFTLVQIDLGHMLYPIL